MLGDELKKLRGEMKQDYLAAKLGISQGHLCNIERGVKMPSIEVLECYCTFFGKRSAMKIIIENFKAS